jgi:YVTN family beta-propeller protein
MKRTLFFLFPLLALALATVPPLGPAAGAGPLGELLAGDADNDGVPDSLDLCPAEDASFFDADGDGCVDETAGARHTEYWDPADLPLTYVISQNGAPFVGDGSDFTALQNAVAAWPTVSGTDLSATYGGTTAQTIADALDQVNQITFEDTDFPFPSSVLAVGITTSFTEPTEFAGRTFRPGQIVDADMIFNPSKGFKTSTSGIVTGTDIEAVAVHEAGHLFGISHSAVETSTMFFVLPPAVDARSLETEDETVILKAYPDATTLSAGTRLSGTVTDGATSMPVPGAAVFAVNATSGDTAGCDYTLPDGSYMFVGLPDGDYEVAIHPLDGSSTIGFLQPGNVNALVDSTAVTAFIPEYWDLAESSTDDPTASDAVTLAGGSPVTGIDIVTNVDVTPPAVTQIVPSDGAADVPVDAAILISFSEPIESSTLVGNFSLTNTGTMAGVGGNAAILNDDSLVAFTPTSSLDFSATYELSLGTGLQDRFGNGLAAPFAATFTTEDPASLQLTSLVPNKGVEGNLVVVGGAGFDPVPANNQVTFSGVPAAVSEASYDRLVVAVPGGASSGPVQVQVGVDVSNTLTYTVFPGTEAARSFPLGTAALGALPRSLDVAPDGALAYASTENGVAAVGVDPGRAGFLGVDPIPFADGSVDVAITPSGNRLYAVSRAGHSIQVIDTDPADGLLYHTVLSTLPVSGEPLGIAMDPTGERAYVPTLEGEIQVWDVDPGSLTLHQQVGAIVSPNPSLRAHAHLDPSGDLLLVPAGSGHLLVFDVAAGTLLAEIPVGSDPHDVAVDPAGQRAYVSDFLGGVTVVSLSSLVNVQEIPAAGSLRGLDVTPGGLFLYTTNRELNVLDVIDLDEANATFRSVVSNVPQGINPVDIEITPDGLYAVSLNEADETLEVTAIGLGPVLRSVHPPAGPEGAKLVLSGIDFGADSSAVEVEFDGLVVAPERRTATSITITAPAGVASGPVRVRADGLPSNPLFFEVLDPAIAEGNLRLAAKSRPAGDPELSEALAVTPGGDIAIVGGVDGSLHFMDTDPSSPTFGQFILETSPATSRIMDVAVTPDGGRALVTAWGDPDLPIITGNALSPDFGSIEDYVDFGEFPVDDPVRLAVSPDGEIGLVADWSADQVFLVDLRPGSPDENHVTASVATGTILNMAFHPGGVLAYLANLESQSIEILDLDRESPTFGSVVASVEMPIAWTYQNLDFTPDGDRCFALTVEQGVPDRQVVRLDTSDPRSPAIGALLPFGSGSGTLHERIDVSPRGTRAVFHMSGFGFHVLDVTAMPESLLGVTAFPFSPGSVNLRFAPDGSRLFAVEGLQDSVAIIDFQSEARVLSKVSGDAQTGIVDQTLPLPLRIQVTDISGTTGVPGVPVTFQVTSGGGRFQGSGTSQQVVVTDPGGYADALWVLGSTPALQTVNAKAIGLSGAPAEFSATALDDPSGLPLSLLLVVPADSSADVSVTTAVQATFSRAVDPLSVDSASVLLHAEGDSAAVPAALGFTDANRKVSLSPIGVLDFSTNYVLEIGAGVRDEDGGPLQNPGSVSFTTAAPQAPVLSAIAPPAGTVGAPVVLSGTDFSQTPSDNTVLFQSAQATPTSAEYDVLNALVPLGATSGNVQVEVGPDTSNALPFYVLVPSVSPADEVLATIDTSSPTKAIDVTPNGLWAYAVSPDGDVVVPIDLATPESRSGVSVGDTPISVDIHPDGTFAYVANFGSSSVSVIDVDPTSGTFNQVVETIIVGANPIDLVASPDGDRLYVANAGSNDLSVVDVDETSATYNLVLATVGGGTSTKTITMSPDGSRIYIGTDTGFIVMDPVSYGVLATVGGGTSTKTMTMSPDGALLIVLTTEGEVLIFDAQPGSPTENQVLATVGGGTSTKTMTMSPDGALLYLVQEESDIILVVSLEVLGSVSVIDPGSDLPPPQVNTAIVDTVEAGEDPSHVAFDPTGSGLAVVTNPGDNTATIINTAPVPSEEVTAQITVSPRTLNLGSRGRWVHAAIELPLPLRPEDIDVSTVRLQGTIPAETDGWSIEDGDGDGIDELVVKFDRAAFQAVLPIGEYVPVTVTGEVGATTFSGEDTIRTIRPQVTYPAGGEVLSPGSLVPITWTTPEGYSVEAVDVHWSPDDGGTWYPVAQAIPNAGAVSWMTPDSTLDRGRVMVTLYDGGEDLGMGMSQNVFYVSYPVEIHLESFVGRIEEGTAVLRWKTGLEQSLEGFHVLRSEREDGGYDRITSALIPASGKSGGADYAFRDPGVRPGRTYFYLLEEVAERGAGQRHGPYAVEFPAVFDLDQNVPNPFNPATTIRFGIPEPAVVTLAVYDLAGRRVRTLVNGWREPDRYEAVWDGRDDEGRRVSSGIYFYRLEAGKHSRTRKMLMVK